MDIRHLLPMVYTTGIMDGLGISFRAIDQIWCEQHSEFVRISLHFHLNGRCGFNYEVFRNVQEEHRHGVRY